MDVDVESVAGGGDNSDLLRANHFQSRLIKHSTSHASSLEALGAARNFGGSAYPHHVPSTSLGSPSRSSMLACPVSPEHAMGDGLRGVGVQSAEGGLGGKSRSCGSLEQMEMGEAERQQMRMAMRAAKLQGIRLGLAAAQSIHQR